MKGEISMYEAPNVERVFPDTEELMNGFLDSGNLDNPGSEQGENENSIESLLRQLGQR